MLFTTSYAGINDIHMPVNKSISDKAVLSTIFKKKKHLKLNPNKLRQKVKTTVRCSFIAQGWKEVQMDVTINVFLLRSDKNVLELDSADGCTIP